MEKRFSAVILAAGESARLGRNKLSLPLGSMSVLEQTLSRFLIDPVIEIIIVTGKFIPELSAISVSPKLRWIQNTHYAGGMSSSVKKGLEYVSPSADGVFITPADIPLFRSETIQLMLNSFTPGKIIIPMYHGTKGHPVLLNRKAVQQCLAKQSEKILYDVIKEDQNAVVLLPVEDEGIVMDIDTEENYEALRKYYDTFIDPMAQ